MPMFIKRIFLAFWLWNQKRLIRPLIKRLVMKPFEECSYEETLDLLHIISTGIPETLLEQLSKKKLRSIEVQVYSNGVEDLFRRLENYYYIMRRVHDSRKKANAGFGVKSTTYQLESTWPDNKRVVNLGYDCPPPKQFMQLMAGHVYNIRNIGVEQYLGELDHSYIERRTHPIWSDLYTISHALLDAVLDLETDDILTRA